MSDSDGFVQYVSKRQRKDEKYKKSKEAKKVIRTFLLSEELKEVCVLSLIDRCRKGSSCKYKHIDNNVGIGAFARTLYSDFTYLDGVTIYRSSIIKHLLGCFDKKLTITLTNCTFYSKNVKCRNEEAGRFIEFPMKFKDNPFKLHICHADVNGPKDRLYCGMHVDFVIDETAKRYLVRKLISEPDSRIGAGYEKKNKRFGYKNSESKEKVDIVKKPDMSSVDEFPDLASTDGSETVASMASDSTAGRPEPKKMKFSYSSKAGVINPIVRKRKAKAKAEAEAKAKERDTEHQSFIKKIAEEAADDGSNSSAIEATIVKTIMQKTKLSMLTDDDFSSLAQDIFDDEIDAEETLEDKVKRLERENIILFKRNIELTDKLRSVRTFEAYYDNRDRLAQRFGSGVLETPDYDYDDYDYDDYDDYGEEEQEAEINAIPHYTTDVVLLGK